MSMRFSKPLTIGLLWLVALALSALLVAMGRGRSDSLPPRPDLIAFWLLAPPLGLGAWLLGHWRLPPAAEGGESPRDAQERQ